MARDDNGRGCEGCENAGPDAGVAVYKVLAGPPDGPTVGSLVQWCAFCRAEASCDFAFGAPVRTAPVDCETCETSGTEDPPPAVMLAPDAEGLDSPACDDCGPDMVSAYADRRPAPGVARE